MTFGVKERLARRSEKGNLRQLSSTPALIDFASNDTLGLARCPLFKTAWLQELENSKSPLNGLCSTGSRLLTGNSAYAEMLEMRIAAFHGYRAGLLFSSGYMANLGLLSAIASEKSSIFFDANIHASTRDGMRLSRAAAFAFRHNDLEHLEKRLKECKGERFICVESLYSTDGALAPLKELCTLAAFYDARLIVDEAHATGIFGPQGRGLSHDLSSHIFAHVVTFGKALGAHGAIVLGSSLLKQTLLNFANSCIYTTALPFQMLAAIHCSYERFPHMEKERKTLFGLIALWKKTLSHIQPIPMTSNQHAQQMAQKCRAHGFDIRPLLSPTVRRGNEILRIALHAFNSEEEIREVLCLIS
jgi:8-amino-7-oxononanoate synthase